MTYLRTPEPSTYAPATEKGRTVGKAGVSKIAFIVFVLGTATAIGLHAQTFTSLVSFDNTNGAYPYYMSLIQGTDGNFYGTTSGSGVYSQGTVFRISANGTLTGLHSFCSRPYCSDGVAPTAGLIQATDGNFYGTTTGGDISDGTIFKITPNGKLTTLHKFFLLSEGWNPFGALVQAADGNLYGTTRTGGVNRGGTLLKITPHGAFTTLYSFCSQPNCIDGWNPVGGLALGTDGDLYGTNIGGGANNGGTIFKTTTAGSLGTLYSFCSQPNCADGDSPVAPLVQGTDGNLYGTASAAGVGGGSGTVFKITPEGSGTTLYTFCSQPNCVDGGSPLGGLVLGTDGDLYGTTVDGGANNGGIIFKITTAGKLSTLYSFCSQNACSDGGGPLGGLLQATDGNFYGATYAGGAYNFGTVFRLSVGLGPFVETQTTSGKVGGHVVILGTNLTGTTSVSFNGTPAAKFTVTSSEIKTTVPAGAITGNVTVTTPSGTLNSNVPFRVTPQIKSFTPTSGLVGTQVKIKGVSLTQTTGIAFSGVAATFTVNSDKLVTTTVPTGASTGPITITTLGGTATSTTSFTVN